MTQWILFENHLGEISNLILSDQITLLDQFPARNVIHPTVSPFEPLLNRFVTFETIM